MYLSYLLSDFALKCFFLLLASDVEDVLDTKSVSQEAVKCAVDKLRCGAAGMEPVVFMGVRNA